MVIVIVTLFLYNSNHNKKPVIALFFSSAAFYINIEEIRFYPEAYLRIAELYDLFDSTLERKRIMPYSMGVFSAQKKNGELYYRASITYHGKHISLGSFMTELEAHTAYQLASRLLTSKTSEYTGILPEDYPEYGTAVNFQKWVMLLNLKENGMYCRNPIYLKYHYFIYYLDLHTPLKFDTDDLFYYMNHKIMRRGGHLFVADYGMQVNILSRYGIRNYGVAGKDYRFVNGDPLDYRYGNIEIINHYHGVEKSQKKGELQYTAKIHLNGNLLVGRYPSEIEAAVAYNKAAALLKEKGVQKNFPTNYIEELDAINYAKLYNKVRINHKIRNYIEFY